jgi:hypothetical protein
MHMRLQYLLLLKILLPTTHIHYMVLILLLKTYTNTNLQYGCSRINHSIMEEVITMVISTFITLYNQR